MLREKDRARGEKKRRIKGVEPWYEKGMERKEAAGSGSRDRVGEADKKSIIIIITAVRPTIINHH